MSTSPKLPGFIAACLFSLFFLTLLPGCSKTGPAGATGPAGPTGAAGAAGPQGPQGPEGNANVFVDTLTLTSSQWIYNSQYSFETSSGSYTEYFTRYHDITDSAVTQGVLDSGQVLAYFVPNPIANTAQWAPLPYQFLDGSGEFNYNVVFQTYVGKIELGYFFSQVVANPTIPTLSTYNIPTYHFKIVVMTGTISTAMYRAGVDVGNYSSVSKFLGLDAPMPFNDLPLRPRAGGHR